MLYRKIIINSTNGFFKDFNSGEPERSKKYQTNIILFIATLISTTTMGSVMSDANPFASFSSFAKGLPYSLTILSILGFHEFGHYFAARLWNVKATLPYFIPFPLSAIGTLGAVIKLKSSIPNKKALIDIGAAGPISGFIVAVIATIIGLNMSEIVTAQASDSVLSFPLGESLLFKFLGYIIIGKIPENAYIMLHPIAFAGWLGLFVTALNLIPFGQLDGGHIMFALSPRIHDLLRRIRIPLLLIMGLTFWIGWYMWALILLFLGSRHPYPDNIYSEIGTLRKIIAFIAIIIFIICMIPAPVLFQ
ncbi:site-2 protease family protein [Candidatus Latescibacterota bacterium]